MAGRTKKIDFWRAAYVECDSGMINATPKVVGCKAIPTPSSTPAHITKAKSKKPQRRHLS